MHASSPRLGIGQSPTEAGGMAEPIQVALPLGSLRANARQAGATGAGRGFAGKLGGCAARWIRTCFLHRARQPAGFAVCRYAGAATSIAVNPIALLKVTPCQRPAFGFDLRRFAGTEVDEGTPLT